jgi:riboflavin biosynthesis pyrimidine reductase
VIQATFGLAESAKASDIPSLAASYGSWVGVRSNHVLDSHGRFSGEDGSSRSISTTEDRELLLALRSRADLLVVDAATARLEQYRAPKSKVPLAIFSSSGDFSRIPAVEDSGQPIYLFTGDKSPIHASNPSVIVVPIRQSPFDGFLEWAKERSVAAILLEAGPSLTAKAFEAGIVRQSAITRTGASPDADPTLMANPFDFQAKLVSLALAPGAIFTLWNH